jgi:hypothetical protein
VDPDSPVQGIGHGMRAYNTNWATYCSWEGVVGGVSSKYGRLIEVLHEEFKGG